MRYRIFNGQLSQIGSEAPPSSQHLPFGARLPVLDRFAAPPSQSSRTASRAHSVRPHLPRPHPIPLQQQPHLRRSRDRARDPGNPHPACPYLNPAPRTIDHQHRSSTPHPHHRSPAASAAPGRQRTSLGLHLPHRAGRSFHRLHPRLPASPRPRSSAGLKPAPSSVRLSLPREHRAPRLNRIAA